ncbi:FAD-dependent oxidoreductase [Phycisphaeraceae bacterium D3-23]
MSDNLPQHARVVVIGGGVVGVSLIYHLTKMGWKDVVLVDKNELTSGATWHAAGLVGQLRSSRNVTRMIQYSAALYRELEQETEQDTGWQGVGSIRIASSEQRMQELRKIANAGRSFGLDVHLLSPKETQDKFPLLDNLDGVVGSAYIETDGYCDPSMLTQSLARGARARDANIITNNRVLGITVENGSATEVVTEKGTIKCDIVVNCAGMWARQLGKMAGVNVPVVPLEHQFMVSEKVEGMPSKFPVTRDPDNMIYYRPEVGGVIMGGFEPNPIPWSVEGVSWDFISQLLEPNYDQFEQLAERAIMRTSKLGEVGVRQLINGPDGYSPDGGYVLGLAPELRNFYVAAGMNCYGIAGAGGVGKVMAEWIIDGEPSLDVYSLDIRRFSSAHNRSTKYIAQRSLEYYPKHYTIAWPMYQTKTQRQLRRSPLYETLKAQGACFGEKSGWERAQWFAPQGVEAKETMTFGRGNWHEHVARECAAIRDSVAILDQSSFGKIEVRGRDALAHLQRLSTRNIDKPVGTLSYTQMCNDKGRIETDLTIARLADDHFYIVTGTALVGHDLDYISKNIRDEGNVVAYNATSSRGVLNLCGPNARKVLEEVAEGDVSHEGFPFGTCKTIYIASAPVLALRVSYHGELGWELHIPTEYVASVYETLMQAGEEHGITNVGYRALESCRLEKGYFVWGADITTDYTPYDANLGFNVHLKSGGDFRGRAALEKAKAQGPKETMCIFTIEDDVELFGSEPIVRDGKVLGILTSGGFGHRIAKTIAMGYVPVEHAEHTDGYTIAAFGTEYKATRHDACPYDPQRARILC